jgi:hypothetical protein
MNDLDEKEMFVIILHGLLASGADKELSPTNLMIHAKELTVAALKVVKN